LGTVELKKLLEEQSAMYERRTRRSKELISSAREYMPGGDTRSVTFFKPYPSFIKEANGCRMIDVDGNTCIDFVNNYTSLVHGHAYPKVLEAVKKQLSNGWAYAAPMEHQYRLAKIICTRFPSVQKVRFNNSGTEATLSALRLATAFTRRDKILKMEGGYHGSHLWVEISVHPPLEKAGPPDRPLSVPESGGIPSSILKDVIVAPFNNRQATEKIIKEHAKELAAVIVEPMMGVAGMIPPKDGYLQFLREITAQYDILLVMDEVMMGRLSTGGGQQFFGVTPDLTTFGKIIGGGFPVGGLGGRGDIMDLFNPERPDSIPHSGTFNANAITMVAGIACMEALTQSVIERMNSLGNQLRKGIVDVFEEQSIAGQVTGAGSYYNIHFSRVEVVDYRSAQETPRDLRQLLHIALLNNGIFIAPRGMFNMSTVMTQKEITAFIEAVKHIASSLRAALKPN
jgi:glutamate-1-semialdehyde 2,1-aminomutase